MSKHLEFVQTIGLLALIALLLINIHALDKRVASMQSQLNSIISIEARNTDTLLKTTKVVGVLVDREAGK